MKKLNPILLFSLLLGLSACSTVKNSSAEKPGGTQTAQRFAITQTRELSADYLLYLPADYDASSGKHWPLIFFLHGAGERGSDVWMVAKHGPPKVDTRMTNFPFIVVSPQCPDGKIWSDDLLLALRLSDRLEHGRLRHLESRFDVSRTLRGHRAVVRRRRLHHAVSRRRCAENGIIKSAHLGVSWRQRSRRAAGRIAPHGGPHEKTG
jgi:hypothetical protein